MKQVHLIGDSHTIMYADLNGICTYHLGACTAYSLLCEHSATQSFQKLNKFLSGINPNYDSVMFGFGEIDCRVLIYFKHRKYSVPIADMVEIVIYRYLAAIAYVKDMGFDITVHGVIPAVQQDNEYNLEFYGDINTRATINALFNQRFMRRCQNRQFKYYDAFQLPYLRNDINAIPSKILLADKVHIDPKKVPIQNDFRIWLKKEELIL